MVSECPSLIESCDFCVFMKLSSTINIGVVLHNQARGTPRFIMIPMTTSYNNTGLVSISFYAIPIFPSKFQFFNLLVIICTYKKSHDLLLRWF